MSKHKPMMKRTLKATRRLHRPTEANAIMRANVSHLLERYHANRFDLKALQEFVAWAGEGNVFEDDFPVVTIAPETRPSLMKPCVQCGQRKPDESFIEYQKQPNGTVKKIPHHYCEDCRETTAGRSWRDILHDEPEFKTRREFTVIDNRRGARVPKAA